MKLVRPLVQAHLPVTVQGVLAARIDQLSAKDKELLQMLALIFMNSRSHSRGR